LLEGEQEKFFSFSSQCYHVTVVIAEIPEFGPPAEFGIGHCLLGETSNVSTKVNFRLLQSGSAALAREPGMTLDWGL